MKKLFAILAAAFMTCAVSAQTVRAGYDDAISKKMEFRADLGGATGSFSDQAILLDLGVGYNFTANYYFGFSSGIYPNFGVASGGNPGPYIPVMGEFTYRWNNFDEKWSVFASVRGGVLLTLAGEKTLEEGNINDFTGVYPFRNYMTFEIFPGFIWRLHRNVDLKVSAGYMCAIPRDFQPAPDIQQTGNYFAMRIGVNLRGKPKSKSLQEMAKEARRAAYERQRLEDEEARQAQQKAREEGERRAAADREARRAAREAAVRASAASNAEIR